MCKLNFKVLNINKIWKKHALTQVFHCKFMYEFYSYLKTVFIHFDYYYYVITKCVVLVLL